MKGGQGGYTLVELIVALAIGALLMVALTSVVFTSWQATNTASSRVEASAQVRNFEYFAYDDFARSQLPNSGSCVAASPCSSQLTLTGYQVSNTTPVPSPVQITYTWDGSNFLDRAASGSAVSTHAASNVTAFSWYVDSNSTVVVNLTVTVLTYSESQTFRFFPRLNP
ncbi:MAG TPA: prepilin-type N-terminal cleavage/methylation domain-containing protein [Candidatus Dormibacteraeota bacterium]|nr:prepilin-type N-terminal cleavage/methylation domain-containing protein [Candidatus Dormibacteraeota bacterium]